MSKPIRYSAEFRREAVQLATVPGPALRGVARWRSATTVLACAAMLCTAAVYNGYPLLYPDTCGYIDAGKNIWDTLLTGTQHAYYGVRSAVYSLTFSPLHVGGRLWPSVLVNALLVAWVTALTVRTLVSGAWHRRCLIIVACLVPLSSASWIVSLVTPDVFAPLVILAAGLLTLAAERLTRWERGALLALCAVAIAAHGTYVLMVAIMIPVLMAIQAARGGAMWRAVVPLAAAWIVAVTSVAALNAYLYGKPSLGGPRPPFLLARVVEDGPGRWYLEGSCEHLDLAVCTLVDRISAEPDDFLWAPDSVYGSASEEQRRRMLAEELAVVRGVLATYPLQQLGASAYNVVLQLRRQGMRYLSPNPAIERYLPNAAPHASRVYPKTRQARGAIPIVALSHLHFAVAGIAALLCAAGAWSLRRRDARGLAAFTVFAGMAIVTVDAITGVLSMPNDRYGARVAWLVPFLAALHVVRWLDTRRAARVG